VLIATYNRAAYLRLAVESVLAQSLRDFALRIVDDASTDATPDVVAAIDDPRVSYARNEHNLGWLGNCNRALEGVTTPYVMLLGDDDVMTPGALERAVTVLDEQPTVGLVHAAFNVIDSNGDVILEATNWTGEGTMDTVEPGREFIRKSVRGGCRVCAATAVMRTALVPATPFLPPDGPAADVGLWLRIALHSDVRILAQPGVNYRVHTGSDSANWSLVSGARYVESPQLIRLVRDMKLRFINENAAQLDNAPQLRSVTHRAAMRTRLLRALGPTTVDTFRTARTRVQLAKAKSSLRAEVATAETVRGNSADG
jgi:glycosyltransferase involved in cell wall biosynthesis